jgi:hypothetical protein
MPEVSKVEKQRKKTEYKETGDSRKNSGRPNQENGVLGFNQCSNSPLLHEGIPIKGDLRAKNTE